LETGQFLTCANAHLVPAHALFAGRMSFVQMSRSLKARLFMPPDQSPFLLCMTIATNDASHPRCAVNFTKALIVAEGLYPRRVAGSPEHSLLAPDPSTGWTIDAPTPRDRLRLFVIWCQFVGNVRQRMRGNHRTVARFRNGPESGHSPGCVVRSQLGHRTKPLAR
jgi:hypothetical protein